MIYKCTNPSCGNLREGDGLPASCPECGSPVKEIREEEMSGRDWSQLGGFWTRRRNNEKRILACYRRAAAMGDVWGICNLGWCMEAGIGTEADPKQAVWLYEQAAETGYVPALCNLGVCYQEGIGVPRDEGRAIELLTDAAEYGYPRAQMILASCYEEGDGVEKDEAAAFQLMEAAAWLGHPDAERELGRYYEYGVGVEKDEKTAALWYQKAARQGNGEAMCNLAFCYESGIGVEKDETKAAQLYSEAAGKGSCRAMTNLYALSRESADPGKRAEGLEHLKRAASWGYVPAIWRLGCHFYYQDDPTGEMAVRAVELFRKAALTQWAAISWAAPTGTAGAWRRTMSRPSAGFWRPRTWGTGTVSFSPVSCMRRGSAWREIWRRRSGGTERARRRGISPPCSTWLSCTGGAGRISPEITRRRSAIFRWRMSGETAGPPTPWEICTRAARGWRGTMRRPLPATAGPPTGEI